MSDSESPDAAAVARELDVLERSVGALLDELEALRRRVAEAEAGSADLKQVLASSGVRPGEAADLQGRLVELTAENEKLKSVVGAAREKAARLRSRLIVMEDEAS